jgi:hypothetical protein
VVEVNKNPLAKGNITIQSITDSIRLELNQKKSIAEEQHHNTNYQSLSLTSVQSNDKMHHDTFFLAHAQNNPKQTCRVTCSILISYFISRVIHQSRHH